MKGNITLNVDTDFEVPARLIAQILAKADSFTQADLFVWLFNRLLHDACNGDTMLFQKQLMYIENDLDHKTKDRLKEWVSGFKPYVSDGDFRD